MELNVLCRSLMTAFVCFGMEVIAEIEHGTPEDTFSISFVRQASGKKCKRK